MKPFAPSKSLQSLFAAVVAGLSLVASGGLAEDVVFEGGTTNWVDGDLVITYADPTVVGKLSLPKTATARILAVGGGGGGGRVTKAVSTVGGGGGGGGGGVVIANGLTLKGEYAITVGAGGAAGAGGTSVSNPGETGGDTSLKQEGVDVITVAKGGGGGGAESDGLPGGSGGGGSMMTGRIEKSGGSGVDGQGHAGGSGVLARGGAGGGGAGAVGATPESTSSGANGGDGVACDITGENLFYGGGGGAGNFYYSMSGKSFGGKGGGGKGLGGRSSSVPDDEVALVNGTDGLGGGGGGGGVHETAVAGRGGSGVLIVRITSYLDAGVTPPTIRSGLVFTGEPQTAGDPDDPNRAFYSVTSGQDTATDAGDYSFTLTLNEGLEWTDGTTDPKPFTWSIAQKVVSVPTARTGLVYDGTEQAGVTNAVPTDAAFYEVTGGSAVNAGDYAFTATLKYAATNVRWADASAQVVDVPWSIARKVVSVPSFTTSFTYEPGQVRTALPASDDYTRTGTPEATDAGSYVCAAVLNNTAEAVNYEWSTGSTGDLSCAWTIAKATNAIEGLRLVDWQVGATANEPSVTRVTNGSVADIVYSYRAQAETVWSLAKPTAAGWYVVRATLAESDNWSEAVAETTFCVWKNPSVEYTYFVDVTNAASAGTGVDVTISETALPGFLYDRTDGLKDGAFRFVYSRTTDPIDDVLLAYSNLTWNISGESTMRVRLPDGLTQASPIRMYWHAQVAEPLSRNDPGAASLSTGTAATGYGLVNSNGVWINYWTQEPSISKTTWDESETPGALTPGALKVGSVKTTYRKLPRGAETETMPLTRGSYAAILTMADAGADYVLDGGARQLQYEILGHSSVSTLGGTASGRILLVNDDTGGNGREAITDQGYWQTADTGHSIYWTHTGTHGVRSAFPFVRQGTSHTLYQTVDDGTAVVLWRIEDGMIGNVFRSGPRANADSNYLPWSPSSKAISAEGAAFPSSTTANGEVGNIIFRNTTDAAIYSPFYTNGVGVVYFDAVNSYTGSADGFKLVVEIATKTATGLVPTDENCQGEDEEGELDPYYNLRGQWTPVAILPLVKDGTDEFVAQTRRTELDLLGFSGGGKTDKFVRGCAEVNVRGPVRFRIRRSSLAEGSSGAMDIDSYQSLLLLDNIIASPPAMYTDLQPIGHYDERKVGKQTLGQECAFSIPFPAVSDTEVYARAKAQNVTNPELPIADSNFVASARFNYRWRYLNQRFSPSRVGDEDRWETVYLDPDDGYRSIEPLTYPAAEGDIEFFYDLTLQAPFYSYQDYSGCGVAKPTGDYTEEIRHWTNRLDLTTLESTRLASGGTNWFVRLRNGTSNWASMKLVLDGGSGGIAGTYDMELTGDNTWRTLVLVPTNAEGVVSFHFEGFNELAAGATEIPADPEAVRWGVVSEGTNAVPATGKLVRPGMNEGLVPLDHVANYLEFKLNDRFETYAITRAEYQDFNHWNDAARNQTFKINYVETNSVDYAAMQTYKSDYSDWALYVSTNKNWNETFYLADYTDPSYPKETLYQRATTPNGWSAQNISWVYESLVSSNDVARSGGMAAKLLGQGGGSIDFTSSDTPSGLDQISFRAHLGQSMTFDSFSYSVLALTEDNYTFHTPLSMSRACHSNGEKIGDMAVGASVSLVAYYTPGVGCYELRISRPHKGKTILLELYKWNYRGNASTSQRLCYTYSDSSLWVSDTEEATGSSGDSAYKKNKYYGAFISCGDRNGGTEIICGVSTDPQNLSSANPSGSFSGLPHVGLIYTDADEPHTYGAYGVSSKDCPAQFVMPSYSALSLQDAANVRAAAGDADHFNKSGDQTGVNINLTANNFTPVRADVPTRKWVKMPGRAECFTNTVAGLQWTGLRTPTNLTQNIEVWLGNPKGSGSWTKFAEVPVSGYAFVNTSSVLIHRTGTYDVRFKTGDDLAVDVVVDDIIQHQWQAPNIETSRYYNEDDYIYTQGIVQENTGTHSREVRLQPSRAVAEEPVSIRSPILSGLGKIAFSYRAADANAEIWVQVATNDVSRLLNTYNLSVDEGAGAGQWTTIRKYGTASAGFTGDDALTTSGTGTKVIYLGWHNNEDRPIRGLFRLFVPTNVVNEAVLRAQAKDSTDLSYGQIVITGMTVTDEPGLSERSWRGWNMRTIGDETDSERRMYLPDMTLADGEGYGLVCGLNNGIWPNDLETTDDEIRLASGFPAIYSPTFKSPEGAQRGIGTVTFKARLYEESAQSGGGQIVGYGSTDPLRGGWVPIFTNAVTRSVFSNYTWTAGTETYYAIKLEVSSASLVSSVRPEDSPVDRVILDEVFVSEKVQPTLAFVYARPFRNNLMSTDPIGDILSANEQPLAGESWGVQAQLTLQQLADEVDLSRGMKVSLSYYPQQTPWGYDNWKNLSTATRDIELTQVGESTNLIFRSVGTSPRELVAPATEAGTIVQFMLKVTYYDHGGKAYETLMSSWTQPDWYHPVDLNGTGTGGYDSEDFSKYSAYTILDSVSPGRAWINEVNWNDGTQLETGGTKCITNQFIEICVPSGADMRDWRVRLTDLNNRQFYLARFGSGLPAVKTSSNATNGYEFVVIQSPATRDAGGIRDAEGRSVADGTWGSDFLDKGTLSYGESYQFELLRPSGVIEHQFVLSGTNEFAAFPFGYIYEGTNLLAELNATNASPLRFYAGDELARRTDGRLFGSAGVIGGSADGNPAPGAQATWKSGLTFTPGHLNEGQIIPEDWLIHPNGTNAWVYLSVVGDHLSQVVAGETNRSAVVVVPQGSHTNVTYIAAPWYEVAALTVNGATNAVNRPGVWTYTFSPTGTTYVVATEGPDHVLKNKFDLGEDNVYTPAVLNWLREKWPDKSTDDIQLARYKGLGEDDREGDLTLTHMYWLDIPAVTDSGTREWLLRGGMSGIQGEAHVIQREYGGRQHTLTNRIVEVKLYLTNEVNGTVYAPQRLQGVNNEKSDTYTGGNWTSVTFKVRAQLNVNTNGANKGYLPLRSFTFGPGSFGTRGSANEFTSRIELLDPFSPASLGYSYGWGNHSNTNSFWFKWFIDTDLVPIDVPVLKAQDVYGSTP